MEALVVREDMDIDALDDSQLYEMLKENNIAAGPIVDSTRNVYKKRLRTVLYGDDHEEEEDVTASDEESEEGNLADERESEEEFLGSNREAEEEIVAGDQENEVDNGDTNYELEIKDNDKEEVLDVYDESPYESKSDTDDDQPSGISRPVPTSGLRKRFDEDVLDSNQRDGQCIAGKGSGAGGKAETSSGWITKAVLSMIAVSIVAAGILFISSLDFQIPETVDSMQEAIQEAANEATKEVDEDIIV